MLGNLLLYWVQKWGKRKQASTNPSGIRRGRMHYPIDANDDKIRPEKKKSTNWK
jgi:hypothetical protein